MERQQAEVQGNGEGMEEKKVKNIIKKLFPKYETKARLRQKLAFQEGMSMMKTVTVERDVLRLSACVEMREERQMPTEYIKETLCHNIAKEIMTHVEFDISDAPMGRKYFVGNIYIATRRR